MHFATYPNINCWAYEPGKRFPISPFARILGMHRCLGRWVSRNAWRRNWVFHNFASGSVASATKTSKGGGFKHVVFVPLSAELIQFDEYVFSGGLQPRTSYDELIGVQLMEACILGFGIHMFHDEWLVVASSGGLFFVWWNMEVKCLTRRTTVHALNMSN